MIRQGLSSPLQFEDLMHLSKADKASVLVDNLAEHFSNTSHDDTRFPIVPRLVRALISAYWGDIACVMLPLTLFEGLCRIGLAMTLRFLLETLQAGAEGHGYRDAYLLAGLLGGITIVLTIVHHVLFFFSMRLGWRWKLATTALIYRKLFELKSSGGVVTETGKLTNLVSNDVFRFENFAVFGCFFFAAPFEVTRTLTLTLTDPNSNTNPNPNPNRNCDR